jgi:hypothetical protein
MFLSRAAARCLGEIGKIGTDHFVIEERLLCVAIVEELLVATDVESIAVGEIGRRLRPQGFKAVRFWRGRAGPGGSESQLRGSKRQVFLILHVTFLNCCAILSFLVTKKGRYLAKLPSIWICWHPAACSSSLDAEQTSDSDGHTRSSLLRY